MCKVDEPFDMAAGGREGKGGEGEMDGQGGGMWLVIEMNPTQNFLFDGLTVLFSWLVVCLPANFSPRLRVSHNVYLHFYPLTLSHFVFS